MKNRIIGVIFLIVFVSINLWASLTKNYSNSFLAVIAGMCLVTAILYFRKGIIIDKSCWSWKVILLSVIQSRKLKLRTVII